MLFDVHIAKGSWDGKSDAEDESIFYYMDGLPVSVGTVIDDFIVVDIYED
jgi:hypothetical protein